MTTQKFVTPLYSYKKIFFLAENIKTLCTTRSAQTVHLSKTEVRSVRNKDMLRPL
ncbi:hypothetical protein HMPREF0663_11855 [Hoylesella oralis ATCC 33269]|uniref:Uncharacterized protein n=1 Tax=Hoylesella oralis ATCC 33269 TaxID=873533 RepID=E7RRQ4_9BACT|nr:hypothetical protein HMPREF0663_11855 [Hoylesella oralis ATCC 33269]